MSKADKEPHPPKDDVRKKAYALLEEGVHLLNNRHFSKAVDLLQQAQKLLPDDPDIMITLSGAMILDGRWHTAERFLEKAVTQHPDNPRLWLNLAAATLGHLKFSTRKRQDKAIVAYERAIALDPIAPSAHYNVGLIHAERKDWEQAIQWFEAAVRADPADKDARLWLARARKAYETSQGEGDAAAL